MVGSNVSRGMDVYMRLVFVLCYAHRGFEMGQNPFQRVMLSVLQIYTPRSIFVNLKRLLIIG